MTIPQLLTRLLVYGGLLALVFYLTLYYVGAERASGSFFNETPQNVLLAGLLLFSGLMARLRGVGGAAGLALLLFFAACAFREFDNELDALLFYGAWKIPAYAMAACLAYVLWKRWADLKADLAALGNTLAFGVFLVGLLLLMVFSRMWGANDLWRELMGEEFNRAVARVSEEGIELMAYTVLCIGVAELYLEARRQLRAAAGPRV